MSTETSNGVTSQDISAYFDDELEPERAEIVARALEADPSLRAEHVELGVMRGAVCATLEVEAQAVPAARFEQIWAEIDRAIERDARLQAEANRNASIWTRLWAAFRPLRVPMVVAAAAAALAVIVVRPSSDAPNKPEGVASVTPVAPPEVVTPPIVEPPIAPDRVALQAPPIPAEPSGVVRSLSPMPVPENNEVEIHDVEFGAGSGSISSNGTVTVLYVEEDEEPTNSERSL